MTGGAGFIGGHLVDSLLDIGARVTVIDDLSSSDGDRIGAVMDGETGPEGAAGHLQFVYGSILDPEALQHAAHDADIVFHLAAIGSVPLSIDDPVRAFAVNATGTLRVLEAARAAGVRRVVYAASSASYGDAPSATLNEDLPVVALSPYAASKAAGEHAVTAYARSMNLDGVSLRYFNVFGPRQRADSAYAAVVPAFMSAVRDGNRPIIFGDGSATRDFAHIDNIVLANLLAAAHPEPLGGAVVNIGCGTSTSVLELARTVAALAPGDAPEPQFTEARAGDVPHSRADISRAERLFGYHPIVDLAPGLADTAAFFGLSRPKVAPADQEPR